MNPREEIDLLDTRVAQLKIEYEQYFMKVIRQEPARARVTIEKVIRRLSTTYITNTGDKFKFNSVVSKFNSYKQYWNRILRAIEEGTYVRHAEGGGVASAPAPPIVVPEAKGDSGGGNGAGGGGGLKGVFEEYIDARKRCNQPVKGLSMEKLEKSIEAQKEKIRQKYGTSNVDIKVSIRDGAARMSITVKKKPPA